LLVLLVSGCGGGGSGGGPDCGVNTQKEWVLATTRDWYYFDDLLPAAADPEQFDSAASLLDFLTANARDEGKDRFFSFLTTRAEDNSFLGEGEFIGFGFRTRTDPGPRVFLSEVFESSPAGEAGIMRGDEIVAVDSGDGFVPTAELLASGDSISDALGPAEAGLQRGLRIQDPSGATREVSLAKRTVTLDPVPDDGVRVLPLLGCGVGCVNLRTTSPPPTGSCGQHSKVRAQGINAHHHLHLAAVVHHLQLLGDLRNLHSDVMSDSLNAQHSRRI
jgi:hypothetical protein